MADVILDNINKIYPNGFHAVKDANFTILDKEFVVLLGPSGCGKTTTLRMIAGLEDISRGTIKIDDKVVNDVEPKDRDIAMVFQNYALYPHMTIYDNMAFGLKLRKLPKDEIDQRVKNAAKILDIEHLLDRRPKQLSGGQRQRVAVGRAIVRDPKVFLFDEPLSNLDAKLRVQMRAELKKLHLRLNATIAYVTHDQVEAMTMADKIVIMKDGYIQQIGNPHDVYHRPENIFVAGFIGTPAMNFLNLKVKKDNGFFLNSDSVNIKVPEKFEKYFENYDGKEIVFGIRPEDIYDKNFVDPTSNASSEIKSKVEVVEPLGSETLLHVNIDGQSITAKVNPKTEAVAEQEFDLVFDLNAIHAFDKETEKALF
ncbi:sn-glycerol-3-phosphate ABC transporter ATP-binding protein UgpC [Oceanotoga sp. DSM 15011]|jgi:multiple sugar transport system ATP-binding protein|uniref:Carbohydrate ABC transporter ATP-binding protein (CUT1 family) n=1 Tax=Oceanotoga teriensis TaxID=515440 RepID=A0AA45C608_9BACT|nr:MULTISPECIES: sn-glycerol-3-phosphate ABC transporter ATP-binding protein UgpC [Oceanotoga]MDN5341487.1 multiple sugar transport system ATP-binding protein [Oceanotoga sp.]MDO7977655.1 sn-glycerol-3-phosphate ABC transporter ATP-binding protein UgpC [Oceanotoga teriensis]PWJ90056.1 carbohydrate ABC transporter ATP-binding protein (CUT1 family) [Oceanotoga teriensis]UYP00518.1 sn-glycerol-3-phosphate ABC transporter ATP-binding protein UgpC [Oceanotoga sp. DSM 15011]